mmetsp:Transcript_26024/g.58869  ORF Transcript_26024/g.58869 Transcript_26024/m.58869 type:complete len:234 (+) Transcript_26024:1190-1891(+)
MAQGVGQRRCSSPVLAVHVRRLVQQKLDQLRVPLACCNVQGRAAVVVVLVDVDAVGQEAINLPLFVEERELAQEGPALHAREREHLVLSAQEASELIVPVPDGVVKRRVAVPVLDRAAGPVLEEELCCLHLALARGDMQSCPAVGVRLVDMQPDPQEPLHLVDLSPPSCRTERRDVLRLPPLVEKGNLLLDAGENHRIEILLLHHRLLIRCRKTNLLLVPDKCRLPVLDDLLR